MQIDEELKKIAKAHTEEIDEVREQARQEAYEQAEYDIKN